MVPFSSPSQQDNFWESRHAEASPPRVQGGEKRTGVRRQMDGQLVSKAGTMTHRHSALGQSLTAFLMSLLLKETVLEYSSKTDFDYEFGDYRGKWCIDDHGFVYSIGEVYYPSPTACPCTCTEDGPVCVRPKCPRIHPRCTRIRYKSCCPVCEAVAKVCIYGGKTYRILEEFKLSRCEQCRCEPNREVYCTISDCPAPHCVNPTYEPNHCCPVCKSGPNCFAGDRILSMGERVEVDSQTVCFCTYRDGTWHTHPHATCERRPIPTTDPSPSQRPNPGLDPAPRPPQNPGEDETQQRRGRAFVPRLDLIP